MSTPLNPGTRPPSRPVAPRPTLPAGLTYPSNPNLCGAWQPGFQPNPCQPGPIPPPRPVQPSPGNPGNPGLAGGVVRTPVRTLLDQQQLANATIAIPPGRAITGLRSYLTVAALDAETVTIFDGVDAIPVRCEATSFRVDWGDRSDATTTRSHGGPYHGGPYHGGPYHGGPYHGGPYPDGDVTHVYENVGRYDLGVSPDWHCAWIVNGTPDAGDTTRTGAPLLDFEVDQVQAVVDG